MNITLQNIGRKYNRNWVFRKVDYEFKGGGKYAILGRNGSGKSTLLQIISGYQGANEGQIIFEVNGKNILSEDFYQYLTFFGPYITLPEEFKLIELLNFHSRFRPSNYSYSQILDFIGLTKERDKEIKNFSSGMKQKLKLGLAFFFRADVVLLDEPCTNLDAQNIAWYQEFLESETKDKLVIIASNHDEEYKQCKEIIEIEKWKR